MYDAKTVDIIYGRVSRVLREDLMEITAADMYSLRHLRYVADLTEIWLQEGVTIQEKLVRRPTIEYLYETHLHTSPVSKCAKASVRETLAFYKGLLYVEGCVLPLYEQHLIFVYFGDGRRPREQSFLIDHVELCLIPFHALQRKGLLCVSKVGKQ